MRVTMLSGVKNVSLTGSGTRTRSVVPRFHVSSTADDLRFVLIKNGEVSRGVLEMELGGTKRDSRRMRPIEKRLRKLVRAEYRALGRYLVLHDKSRRRRRNGWAKDLGKNLVKVIRRR
jgi:hypothetical protein